MLDKNTKVETLYGKKNSKKIPENQGEFWIISFYSGYRVFALDKNIGKAEENIVPKEYSVTFNNDKYCTIRCTWNSNNGIAEDLIYKLDNEEDDIFGSYSGKLFYAESKEYYGELCYAKDGSWIAINSKENYIDSKRLRKVN